MSEAFHFDVVVIGSGAGGLATAVTAAHFGLKVAVLEKEAVFGGTTAWSGGWMFAPCNPLAQEAGLIEDSDTPRNYLKNELGNHYDAEKIERFLTLAPEMVSFFREHTDMAFIAGNAIPDFHGNNPYARDGGRSVGAAPFDGRQLGARFKDLKRPLPAASPFGLSLNGAEMKHFLQATYHWKSFWFVAKRLTSHFKELAFHGRATTLNNGNALIARLLKSCDRLNVQLFKETPACKLQPQCVETPKGLFHAKAIVLATGGFPHAQEYFARPHHSAAPLSNQGDGIRLGLAMGGQFSSLKERAGYAPVSLIPGEKTGFPHLIERGKAGLIAVTADGKRFCNEADSYYDVMSALHKCTPKGEAAYAWLIVDHAFMRHYGLGRVRPRPFPLRPWLKKGYLYKGTLTQICTQCKINAEGLSATLEAYNAAARTGIDPLFKRGETAYNRMQGESTQQPNPCVREIDLTRLYAMKIHSGSLGTFDGLITDADGRVLDAHNTPIEGLYAVGNDMASVMGGFYPSGGITLGPAMSFGYQLGKQLAHSKRGA